MANIFVSYTNQDRLWALWIGHELQKLGHEPHVHEWEVSAGGDIAAWMEVRHNEADHVLCVVSKTYLAQPYSNWERRSAQWAAATNRPNFVLPIRVEHCELQTLFAQIKGCDLFGCDEESARQRLRHFLTPAQIPIDQQVFPGSSAPASSRSFQPEPVVFPGAPVPQPPSPATFSDAPVPQPDLPLVDTLKRSGVHAQHLWICFILLTLLLLAAILTTTPRMLFLASPLFDIIPLLFFYTAAPMLFVIFHCYFLMYLMTLARTARSFEEDLQRALPNDRQAQETFRMRVEDALFARLLVGSRGERQGMQAGFWSFMAQMTVVWLPMFVLLRLQIAFLPYHSETISWTHRILLAIDLGLVWTLWPTYRSGWGARLGPAWHWKSVMPVMASAAVLAYATLLATFPDETAYVLLNIYGPPTAGWLDLLKPTNTLDLRAENLVDTQKLQVLQMQDGATPPTWISTISLKKRDLTEAQLRGADIRHADFSYAILNRAVLRETKAEQTHFGGAQMRNASLDGANLQGASFDKAKLSGASFETAMLQGASLNLAVLEDATFDHAQLQGASLKNADGSGASFMGAQLQAASLNRTQLQRANLDDAQLQGASIQWAQLQAASLDRADLQGALLDQSDLQGASLNQAQLQGASLADTLLQGVTLVAANLQGASLPGAQLQAASLNDAKLQGALLSGAQLQGASLNRTQLQGAFLDNAQLQGAYFREVCVWRADALSASWNSTYVQLAQPCAWTGADFYQLIDSFSANVPDDATKASTIDLLRRRLDPSTTIDKEAEIKTSWERQAAMSPSPSAYLRYAMTTWRDIGCTFGFSDIFHQLFARLGSNNQRGGTSHNISNLLDRDLVDAFVKERKSLAAAFLDEAKCHAAYSLSDGDKALLQRIRADSSHPLDGYKPPAAQ